MDIAADWLQPGFAALMNLALALLAGSAALRVRCAHARLETVGRLGLMLLGLGLLGDIGAAAATMSGEGWGHLTDNTWTMLTQTHAGHSYWLAIAGWALLFIALWLRARARLIGFFTGLLAVSVARAANGHAGTEGLFTAAVFIHTLHILAAATWVGSVLAWLALPRTVRAENGSALTQHLSEVATMSLLTVLGTGIIDFSRSLSMAQGMTQGMSDMPGMGAPLNVAHLNLTALWHTDYIQLLAAKLSLVALAAALGGSNRWLVMPYLRTRTTAPRQFDVIVLVESVVLVGVMLLAAKLGVTMPGE